MKTQMIHARIDQTLKKKVEAIFTSLGMNTSDAIRLFFYQVILTQGLPFDVKIPNKETQAAIKDSMDGKNLQSCSAQEFHDLLNAQ